MLNLSTFPVGCQRLLRPADVTFLKTGWYNPNVITSWMARDLKLRISICTSLSPNLFNFVSLNSKICFCLQLNANLLCRLFLAQVKEVYHPPNWSEKNWSSYLYSGILDLVISDRNSPKKYWRSFWYHLTFSVINPYLKENEMKLFGQVNT